MADYIKGEKPREMDAAKGGLVIKRLQHWAKDGDDYHPMGTGLSGPENAQNYSKVGGLNDHGAVRKGDTKARSMSTLKKSKGTAL